MAAGAIVSPNWSGTSHVPPTPLDLNTAEQVIVRQLQANIPPNAAECAAFPDKWDDYRMTHQTAVVLVRFAGSDYGELTDVESIIQWRRMEWDVTVIARVLGWQYGGQGGAYALIESVRQILTGFRIPGFRKAYPIREKYLGRNAGSWAYNATYAFPTMAMQIEPAVNLPIFIKGSLLESDGVSSKAVSAAAYTFSGSTIALPQGNLSNLVVSNPSGGAVYLAGSDYSVDTVNGIITRISGGAVPAGGTVDVSYVYADWAAVLASGGSVPFAPTN